MVPHATVAPEPRPTSALARALPWAVAARVRRRRGAAVGAVAHADAGGSSAGAAGRRFGTDVSLPAPGRAEQCRDLARRHATGLRLGHAHEAVHPPARSTESHRASGNAGGAAPFFSPDGQWVGFSSGGKVNKISVEGGAVVPLGERGHVVGASWGEDGSIFVSPTRNLLRIRDGGGAPRDCRRTAQRRTARC